MFRKIMAGLLAFVLPFSAFADAVLTSARGDIRANNVPVTVNQQIASGTTVTTGPDAQAVLRFDDGQGGVLNQNTEFRIVDYRHTPAGPQQDTPVLHLLLRAPP